MDDMPFFPYHLLDMELYIKNIKKKILLVILKLTHQEDVHINVLFV